MLRYFVPAGEDTFTNKIQHPKQENAVVMEGPRPHCKNVNLLKQTLNTNNFHF